MSPWRVTYLLVLVSTFAASDYSASFDCSKSAAFSRFLRLPEITVMKSSWNLRVSQ